MTATAAERTTSGEVENVQTQALQILATRQEIPLTELLTELVRDAGHRVEIVSRALTTLATEGRLTLTSARTIKPV